MNKYEEVLKNIKHSLFVNGAMGYEEEVKMIEELIEKATPKKPKKTEIMGEHYYACPRCGGLIKEEYHVKNILKSPSKDILPKGCENCLQAIDWSNGE